MDCEKFINLAPEVATFEPEDSLLDEQTFEEFDKHLEECESCKKIFDYLLILTGTLEDRASEIFRGRVPSELIETGIEILRNKAQKALENNDSRTALQCYEEAFRYVRKKQVEEILNVPETAKIDSLSIEDPMFRVRMDAFESMFSKRETKDKKKDVA